MLTLLQLLVSACVCVFTLSKRKVFNGSLQHLLTKDTLLFKLYGVLECSWTQPRFFGGRKSDFTLYILVFELLKPNAPLKLTKFIHNMVYKNGNDVPQCV